MTRSARLSVVVFIVLCLGGIGGCGFETHFGVRNDIHGPNSIDPRHKAYAHDDYSDVSPVRQVKWGKTSPGMFPPSSADSVQKDQHPATNPGYSERPSIFSPIYEKNELKDDPKTSPSPKAEQKTGSVKERSLFSW